MMATMASLSITAVEKMSTSPVFCNSISACTVHRFFGCRWGRWSSFWVSRRTVCSVLGYTPRNISPRSKDLMGQSGGWRNSYLSLQFLRWCLFDQLFYFNSLIAIIYCLCWYKLTLYFCWFRDQQSALKAKEKKKDMSELQRLHFLRSGWVGLCEYSMVCLVCLNTGISWLNFVFFFFSNPG